jgi:hypothetical protein
MLGLFGTLKTAVPLGKKVYWQQSILATTYSIPGTVVFFAPQYSCDYIQYS